MKSFMLGFVILSVLGCSSVGHWHHRDNLYLFRGSPNSISLARRLTEDYLEGQKKGESCQEAALKYGPGVVEFYGLKDYRYLESHPNDKFPCLKYRIQASNQVGGVLWDNLIVCFTCDRESPQDFYGGLSISEIIRP